MSALEFAISYTRQRCSVVPVPYRDKNPGTTGWSELRLGEDDLPRHFHGRRQNVGILLGAASNGIIDLDLDCALAITLAPHFLPSTKARFGHASKRLSHYLYRCVPTLPTTKFLDVRDEIVAGKKKRCMLLEYRSDGAQTVVPGSTHESGELIEFEPGDSLAGAADVEAPGLLASARKLAAAVLLAKYWPGEGSRHETEKALAGGLIGAGWAEEHATDFICAVAEADGGELFKKARQRVAADTAKRIRKGGKATGWTKLSSIIGKDVVARVREWLGISKNSESPPASPQTLFTGDPIPLDAPVPTELPSGSFPGWLGEQVEAVAAATETPRELPGLIGLAVAAACVQGKVSVLVEPGYFEQLSIWAAVALVPGNRKTAVMKAMSAPVFNWEREQRLALEPQIKKAESLRRTTEARIKALREKASKKPDGGDFSAAATEIADLEASLQPIPTMPRLLAEDITPEHTATIMSQNQEKIGLISDEGGLFDVMAGRYSNGIPNLDVFLKSYSGANVRVDRGSRPSIQLDHPALSIGLSPQPAVLQGLASRPGFLGRGLLDRFWYAVPKSRLGLRTLLPQPVPDRVAAAYDIGMRDLIALPSRMNDHGETVPHVLTLSAGAYELWKALQKETEQKLRAGGDLEQLCGWGAKLPGATARIAGIFHCVVTGQQLTGQSQISADSMAQAIRLALVLIEHAKAVFSEMGCNDDLNAARRLWKIISRAKRSTFSARDAWHPLRGTYKKVIDVAGGFDVLIDHNVIAEPHQADYRERGRPSRAFKVHPSFDLEDWK